jgi:hypothetical protein
MNYIIWWLAANETQLLNLFPGLDVEGAEEVEPSLQLPEFPNGFKWVEQSLSPEEFVIVDEAAEDEVAINVKPAPHPPYSPTQR